VGSSQNCALPTAVCNTIWACGAAFVSAQLEKGSSLRDAVASTFKECREVIFTGNGYSAEWPVEAKKRGLPNLNTTPLAIDAFTEPKNQEALASMKVLSKDESAALAETMYENYISTLSIEVETMLTMVHTGFMPAFARDLAVYKEAPELAGERKKLYSQVQVEATKLKTAFEGMTGSLKEEAAYVCNNVKPQMDVLRKCVDDAEKLMEKTNYPYPTYDELLYAHHF
jgi:glutamine synthetase